jgi:hypothetical protein
LFEKLIRKKPSIQFIKVFYPIQHTAHMTTKMSYFPGGEPVSAHIWEIFTNLLDIDKTLRAEVSTEKGYTGSSGGCPGGFDKGIFDSPMTEEIKK